MWHDISRPLVAGMEVYPGDPGFESRRLRSVERDGYQLTEFSMSAHCGTHVDAPAHFLAGGKRVEALDGELFIGPAVLIEVRSAGDFRRIPAGASRVLVRDAGYGGLRENDVQAILDAGVRLLGTDRLSVAADEASESVHVRLLKHEVLLLEGLLLDGLAEGGYELVALPLRLSEAEGAPARAFVRALPCS